MSDADAYANLHHACASERWAQRMLKARPYGSLERLLRTARDEFDKLTREDILQAFAGHPIIGADLAKLREKFASTEATTATASFEAAQAMLNVHEDTLRALRDANVEYVARFGYIFIVCAKGKTADEMLALIRARLANAKDEEWPVACEELFKITCIRLTELGDAAGTPGITASAVDADGRAIAGLRVLVERRDVRGHYVPLSAGTTNIQGMVRRLVGIAELCTGAYRLTFDLSGVAEGSAYPAAIPVVFEVAEGNQHVPIHIPLRLLRRGFSTELLRAPKL